MLQVLHRAIQLNNLGAVHLHAHNVGDAVRAFREGITYLKQATAAVDEADVDQGVVETLGNSLPFEVTGSLLIQVHKLEHDRAATATCCSSSSCSTAFYFSHPFLLGKNILTSTSSTSMKPQEYLCATNQVSAVMLFNFALAHHLHGVRQARAAFNRSAIRLYNMSLGVLQSLAEVLGKPAPLHHCRDSSSSSCTPSLLILLCLNNIAQIYYDELCEYEPMKAACTSMQRMIREPDSSVLLLSVEEADALTLNATLLCSPFAAGVA